MNYWPGTKIIKSQNNAFDWKGQGSTVMRDKTIKASNNAKIQMAGAGTDPKRSFTIYSRAKRVA